MRNRVILIGITLAIWVALKALDSFVTGPELLILLFIALSAMITHSMWLYSAQSRWQRRARQLIRRQVPFKVRRVLKRKSQTDVEMVEEDWHPWVDIFISAKNEANVIATTVANMFKLNYDRFYVWIIDDCSTDEMPVVLKRLQEEYPNLRVVTRKPGSWPGKSAALNDALALAKGDVVAVFDADAYVEPDFLTKVLPSLASDKVGAVQVQKRVFESQKETLPRYCDAEYALDTYFQVGRDLIGGAVELRGNGELIKRNALIDVGGWNNNSITDDLDLSMRLLVSNWDIKFCPEASVWEEGVTTLKALLRQRRRWAEGSIRRYLDYIFPLNSPTRLSLVERIDTLVFTVYFVVPALILLELTSEIFRFSTGVPTYGRFLALASIAVMWVTQINCFISVRLYRDMPFWKALFHSIGVNAYIWAHWVPVIVVSFGQILFGKQASTWVRTEHHGAPPEVSTEIHASS